MPPDPPKNSFSKKACFGNACSPALPVPEQLPYPGYATECSTETRIVQSRHDEDLKLSGNAKFLKQADGSYCFHAHITQITYAAKTVNQVW